MLSLRSIHEFAEAAVQSDDYQPSAWFLLPDTLTARPERMWTDRERSDVNGIAAVTAGRGQRVVLLHGVGLRAEAWSPVIDALASQFEVLAPDLPGHGSNSHLDGQGSLLGFSDCLAPLLGHQTIVVGHSMGAMIATDLAARYSGQIAAVAALNAIFERDPAAQDAVRERANSINPNSPLNTRDTLNRWFGTHDSDECRACSEWLSSVDLRRYKEAYSVFANENGPSRADLRRLSQPSLFMTGKEDPNSTPDMSQLMGKLALNGQAIVVNGAAHMLPMTHPEVVLSALNGLAEQASHQGQGEV